MAEGAVTVLVAEALFVRIDCEVVKLSIRVFTCAAWMGAARSAAASNVREKFFMG